MTKKNRSKSPDKRVEKEPPMSGPELTALAKKLVDANDPKEIAALRASLTRGFYGGNPLGEIQ